MRTDKRSFILICLISITFSTCGTRPDLRKVDINSLSNFKYAASENGIIISIDPFTEKERLIESFGDDLMTSGIMPIHIKIRNEDANDGYMLLSNQAKLLAGDIDANDCINKEYIYTDEVNKSGSLYQASTILLVSPLIGLPFIAAAESNFYGAIDIAEHIQRLKIIDRPLYRNSENTGFIFFKITEEQHSDKSLTLQLTVKSMRTSKERNITIPFSIIR